MHRTCTVLTRYAHLGVLIFLGFITYLTLTASRSTISENPPGLGPGNSGSPPARYWGPLRFAIPETGAFTTTDPIRFSIQSSKQSVKLNETVELTITAELLNISPNLLFFQPGATAYTLKMLLPPGFEPTGGNLVDYVSGELSFPNHPLAVYHLKGRFREFSAGASFRLLRGQTQSGSQGLFVEKATVHLQGISADNALSLAQTTAQPSPHELTLYVVTENNLNHSARIAGANYIGYLDYAACDTIRGWVCNTENFRQSQRVDIYINGIRVINLPANSPRPDVAKSLNVNDFDQYGFKWVVPALYQSRDSLTISVRPAETVTDLRQSPVRTAPCSTTGIALQPPRSSTAVATVTTVAANSLVGYLDNAECDTLRGWLCNLENLQASQQVDIYINNVRVGSASANLPRPDVARALLSNGFDQYGFKWVVPEQYRSKDPLLVSVRVAGTSTDLRQSPTQTSPCSATSAAVQQPGSSTAVSTTAVSTTAVSSTAVSTTATSATATSATATSASVAAPKSYVGFLDYAGCDFIQGWICNANDLAQSQTIDIYINSTRVASLPADLPRSDVAQFLKVGNFDRYGFKWIVPALYQSAGPLTVSVRPVDTATDLRQSPMQTSPCSATSAAVQQPGSSTAVSTTAVSTTAVSSTAVSTTATSATATSATATSATPANPYSTTTTATESASAAAQSLPSFRRGVVIGNSITLHAPSIDFGWFNTNGMAASQPNEDYVHKIETALKLKNPAFELLAMGSGASLEGIYNSLDTSAVNNNITNIRYDITKRYGSEKLDLFILSISENVANSTFNEAKFRAMLSKLMASLADKLMPGATIIFRNGLWVDHDKADLVLRNYAQENGYKFADMSDLAEKRVNGVLFWQYYANSFQNNGVRRHPNDLGHSVIAARFLSLLLPQATPPTSTTSPDAPFAWQVPVAESDWDGVNTQAIGYKNIVAGNYLAQENDQLRIELRQGFGGSLQIYDKITKQNLINFFDQGRESGLSSYSGPLNFSNYTSGPDKQAWWNIGYNPVPPGDHGGNASPILFKGKVDGWLYTKAQSISWPHIQKTILPMTYEQWIRVNGNKVEVKVRLVHSRPDKTQYEARSQEWPFVMVNGARISRFYTGDQPFSFQPSTGTNGIERTNSTGTIITHQGTPFFLTEPWMATEIGRNPNGETRLFGLVSPTMYKSNYNVAVPEAGDNFEGGNTMTYLCGQPFDHLDSDKTTYFSYTFVIGTETEVRSTAYAIPRMDKPDFKFTQKNGRAGWYWFDGALDQKEPFADDNWKLTFVGKTDNGVTSANNTKIISPAGAWRAAQIPVIYVRMKTNTSRSQMALGWALNQQAPDGTFDTNYATQNQVRYPKGQVNNTTQRQVFAVTGDNQWHTYAIPVSSNSNWNGIVQQLEIKHEGSGTVPINETFEIAYIGANNPGN